MDQHQQPCANEQDRSDGALFRKRVERVSQGFAKLSRFGRAVGIDGHVDPQSSYADPQSCFRSSAHRTVNTTNEEHQKNSKVNHALAELLVIEGPHPRENPQKESQHWIRSGLTRRCCRQTGRRHLILRLRRRRHSRCPGGDSNDACQALFAIENVPHRTHTRRAHGLAAIAAVTDRVHIGLDGTPHATLLSLIEPLCTWNCVARIRRLRPISSARFCCFVADGFVLSLRPGCLSGEFCGADCSLVPGFCSFSLKRVSLS